MDKYKIITDSNYRKQEIINTEITAFLALTGLALLSIWYIPTHWDSFVNGGWYKKIFWFFMIFIVVPLGANQGPFHFFLWAWRVWVSGLGHMISLKR